MIDLHIINRKLYITGRAINHIQTICDEVYQQFTENGSFKVKIGSCTDDRYFEFISFVNYPFKLIIGMPYKE